MSKLVKVLLVFISGLFVLFMGWGLIEPYFIDEPSYTVPVPGLPEAWQGQQVAVVSDFQVGMWLDNVATVERVVDRLIQKEPAAVFILGDFIYHGGEDATARIEKSVALVRPLTQAGIPVYAVLGNHDYSVESVENPQVDEERARRLAAHLASAGVRVLENESVPLTPPSGVANAAPLYLVGIGAHMPGRDRPGVALAGVPPGAARLVLMHHPNTFAGIPPHAAPLAIAGHTHGGQLRLPFAPQWSWLTFVKQEEVHTDGWIRDYGQAGNRLYVNRGVGFSKLPLRINCPPEITTFTLVAGTADPSGE